jgi:hypothetical protein
MLDTTTLNASEAASAVRPTGCRGQEAASRLIAWPRVGSPVPAGPRMPFMLPSLQRARPADLGILEDERGTQALGRVTAGLIAGNMSTQDPLIRPIIRS